VIALFSKNNDLTQGTIWKNLVFFAVPIFLGNLFQQLYNTVDSLIVGRFLGDTALAAVSSSGTLIFMMIGFFNGLAMGAGVLIARFYGARDYEGLRKILHTDVAFGLVMGLVLTVVGIATTPVILRWMDTPMEVMPDSVVYFRYYFCGAVFSVMYNIMVGILHALGDSRHPLYYLIAASMINVVLDLVLVGGLGFGVGAAALATTISQGVSALLCAIRLVRMEGPVRLEWKQIRIHGPSLKNIISIGLPSGIQGSVISIANVVVQANINAFGTAAMAGCGAFSKLEGFAFLPVTCFSQALTTFVGQNLGAHNYDRVKKGMGFGIFFGVGLAELVGIGLYLLAPQLIALFNSNPEVVAYGVLHCRITTLFYFLMSFSHCAAGVLRGAGKASVPMLVMLLFWCLLRVTYITFAVQIRPELSTLSWAYPLTWTCSSIVFLVYLLKGNWLHNFDRLDQKSAAKA